MKKLIGEGYIPIIPPLLHPQFAIALSYVFVYFYRTSHGLLFCSGEKLLERGLADSGSRGENLDFSSAVKNLIKVSAELDPDR